MISRKALAALVGLALLLPGRAATAQGDEETVLPGSGIHYPGGFDANTVGDVRGRASGFARPERGPVRFRLDSGKDTYIVLAAPGWYWNDLEVAMPDGADVRVRGSKSLGGDGSLYMIAQEIEVSASGRRVAFRDEDGYPLWKGGRAGAMGTRGGAGSPMRGGTGGGAGGMGRGRR